MRVQKLPLELRIGNTVLVRIKLDGLLQTAVKVVVLEISSAVLLRRRLMLDQEVTRFLGVCLRRQFCRGENLLFAAGDWRLVYVLLGFDDDVGLYFLAARDVGQTTFYLLASRAN